jgi:hypothetical protein
VLQQRVALDSDRRGLQFHVRHLQQLDRLLQLRRLHQGLAWRFPALVIAMLRPPP